MNSGKSLIVEKAPRAARIRKVRVSTPRTAKMTGIHCLTAFGFDSDAVMRCLLGLLERKTIYRPEPNCYRNHHKKYHSSFVLCNYDHGLQCIRIIGMGLWKL